MHRRVMPVLLLVVVAVFALGGVASAATYTSAAECYACHGISGSGAVSKVDFDASLMPVDRNACKACHGATTPYGGIYEPPTAEFPNGAAHVHYGDTCANCHDGDYGPLFTPEMGAPLRGPSLVPTPYGLFRSYSSPQASAATIHAAHRGASWVTAPFGASRPDCQPCHTSASCSVCHVEPLAHGSHGASASCVASGCHNVATATVLPSCTGCHPVQADPHGYDTVDHVADDAILDGTACSACHSLELATVHGDPGAAGASCTVCHPAPRDTFGAWDQSCATGGCHTTDSTAPMHAGTDEAHAVATTNALCLDCHTGTELGSIHAAAVDPATGKTSCFVCHTGVTGEPSTSDCTLCHFTFDEHYGAERHTSSWAPLISCGGSGCHDMSGDLMTVHTEKNAAFTCAGCHENWLYADEIEAGLTGCGDCHSGITQSSGHRDAHDANPPLETDTHVPNYAYSTGSVGSPKTTDCMGCHTSNLVDEHLGLFYVNRWIISPRFDSSGAPLTCATCHSSADSTVLTAIEANLSACESCHPVHGPVAAIHASSFDTSSGVDCAECHSSQLESEHNGTYTTTTPSGRTLSGCSVCHSYWEGERGAEVEGVISASGQTQCSACHGTQHPDLGSHTVSSAASQECATCHDEGGTDTIDVKAIHANASLGACAVCHDNVARVGDISAMTADCASCHAAQGTDYHTSMSTAHTYGAMDASCAGVGCHVANTLPEEHERFLADSGFDSTCALCHENPAVDLAGKSAACDSCHTVHGDVTAIHTAAPGEDCSGCHGTTNALELHVDADGNTTCATCHNATTTLTAPITCASCHAALAPVETGHYPTEAHLATETGCSQCHYMDMKAEHFKTTVAVSCVTCHETKVDAFTTAWDKTCTACHPTNHGEKNAKHVSTTTTCGGTACHNIGDVAALHGAGDGPGCGACHVDPATPATTTACTASGCHAGVGTDHKGLHDAASVNPRGCGGCHSTNLVDEHQNLGLTCNTCHDSTAAAVAAAIAANDLRCVSCHPDQHKQRNWEFNPGRASVHRVSADLPGMRSSFVVNGSTYNWTLPSAGTFLKTGWTTSSMMECSDCHSYSGAAGPHGSTMRVNLDPAYPNPFERVAGSSKVAQLSPNSATGMSMTDGGSTPAGIICEKCHDLSNNGSWSNIVHKEHDDRGSEGGYCNHCHTGLAHGWSRPRMLGYTTDAAPYKTTTGGIQRISLKSYTPNSWQKSDCGAGCSSSRHPLSGSSWPAVDGGTTPPAPTTGTVSGTVKDSATNAGIAGATVTVGTKTATTSSTGAYTLADVTAGSYAISVTATGYNAWSGNVTVSAGATATQNASLAKTPAAPTTGTISGTVKDGATNAGIAGATVTVGTKTATTSSTGTYTLADVTAGSYAISVTATGYDAGSGSVTVTAGATATQNFTLVKTPVTPPAPTPANLARTGTASASSTSSSSYAASKAIDGSTSTYWRSNGSRTEWLRLDLGATKTLSSVVVKWNSSSYARSYRIETSNDGSNWTSRDSTSSGNGGDDTITLSAVSARYVRVYCTSANDRSYQIREFEVWGN